MHEIPYETGCYYVFDRGYNNFKEFYRTQRMESFFVVRAKTNLQYKYVKWKRRLPKNVLTDAEIELTVYKSELFDKTIFNDVKEQLGPLIPGLFD